ncbi:acetylxylan esterase [Actinoplanes sp. CA-142083]|uniref:acetylxylan esterase n=1 Tax=Actinoplanes sp. CA-142083 TaxID=3239903 RepID=UPI003D8F974A
MAQFDLSLSELPAFQPVVAEPDDFDAFWRRTLEEQGDLDAVFEPHDALLPGVEIFDVRFTGFGGGRVAAWFLVPRHVTGPLPTIIQFIGYGGGRGRPHEWLLWPAAGYAVLVMDSRGQGDGDTADLPGVGPQHVGLMTRGVLDPEQYYYRRLFTDAVRAVDAAKTRPEVDPARIVVAGASQGGGLAQAVAGLRDDLAGAIVDVPFLTYFRRATEISDSYPYREIADLCATNRDKIDQVFTTLAYFDGVHFAARGHVPALYTVGLMDAVCPPSTVFAAYNRRPGPKEMLVWPYNGHEGGATFQPPESLRWLRNLLS